MKTINIVTVAGVDFILKGSLPDHDSIDSIEVVKVYSKKKNIDLKPFLSDNALFMIENELKKLT